MPYRSGAFRQTLQPFGGGSLSLDQLYSMDTVTSGDGTPPPPPGPPEKDTSPPGATPKPPVIPKVGPLPKPKAAAKPAAKPKITANAVKAKPVAKPVVKAKPAIIPAKKVIVDPNQDYQKLTKPEQPGRPLPQDPRAGR